MIAHKVGDLLVGTGGKTPEPRHHLGMSCKDGFEFCERNGFSDTLLELPEKRHVQEIKKITIQNQLHPDRTKRSLSVHSGGKELEELDHLLVEKEVLVGIVFSLEKTAR